MARGIGKKSSKATPTNNTSSAAKPSSTTETSADTPPSPFEPASTGLGSFVKTLPRDHVFVVHLERTRPDLRKQTFIVPIILNVIITLGLCWRIYYAAPVYLTQMITILGYETDFTVPTQSLGWTELVGLVGERTILLTVDYAIFGLLGRWPWEFLFGDKYGRHVGCAGWKWSVGFGRSTEVVVRRGRKWDVSMFQSEEQRKAQARPEKTWTQDEELSVHTKCTDALRKQQTSKNALSLLDKDWDLDYAAMVDATELIVEKKLKLSDVDQVVLVPWQGKWFSWYPHHVMSADGAVEPAEQKDESVEHFKHCLREIGCEDVFYRWVEIVQYETVQPSGFTPAKKHEAEQELRRMLKDRKKDDDAFMEAVGGRRGVPGLTNED